jgi:hypothetical protein
MTGLMIFLGRTPIVFSSELPGATETSTFGAELSAMRTAVEGLISIQYMMHFPGVKVEHPSLLFGDHLGVIHKHAAISYHKVRRRQHAASFNPSRLIGGTTY